MVQALDTARTYDEALLKRLPIHEDKSSAKVDYFTTNAPLIQLQKRLTEIYSVESDLPTPNIRSNEFKNIFQQIVLCLRQDQGKDIAIRYYLLKADQIGEKGTEGYGYVCLKNLTQVYNEHGLLKCRVVMVTSCEMTQLQQALEKAFKYTRLSPFHHQLTQLEWEVPSGKEMKMIEESGQTQEGKK